MANMDEATKELIISLHQIGAIKFGSFTLKSGMQSPVYFDLRLIISHPKILKLICDIIWTIMITKKLKYDTVCGVPYTAIPIASVVSVEHDVPMILKRKEQKKYGTGNILEGSYSPNSACLIIEDVVTTGSSVLETVQVLRDHKVAVTDAIVLLNREQGAEANLTSKGIQLHSILGVHEILDLLHTEKLITGDQFNESKKFILDSATAADENARLEAIVKSAMMPRIRCKLSHQLLEIMLKKQTNLALAADLDNFDSVLKAVEAVGEHICIVKTHLDLLNMESIEQVLTFRRKLRELAQTHSFLIMEDRKLGDIGSTVLKQLEAKPWEIGQLANFVTVHGVSGPGSLKSISNSFPQMGIILVAEMSSEQNLTDTDYKNGVVQLAKGYENFVSGFVAQSRVGKGEFLQFTPGVGLNVGGDGLGQQYGTVQSAVEVRGADVIIVGRGMLNQDATKWPATAIEFKRQGWDSWRKRVLHEHQ